MESVQKNIEKIINLMLCDSSVDAPKSEIEWAKSLSRSIVLSPEPSLIHRIVAVLVRELSVDQRVFGERSSSPAAARQMLFTADDYAIDLRLTSSSTGTNIHGQILGDQCDVTRVNIHNREFSDETMIDDSDEFRINNVPSGVYALVLSSDKVEIVLNDLEID